MNRSIAPEPKELTTTSGHCVICGREASFRFDNGIITPQLRTAWGITDEVAEAFNRRESMFCSSCGSSLRVRRLCTALIQTFSETSGRAYDSFTDLLEDDEFRRLRIAEINACGAFHNYLEQHPNLCYSEYVPGVPCGSEYNGIRCEDLQELTYPDDYFDIILTSDTLEHVPDPDKAWSEVRRTLKPSGYHIFTIPVVPAQPGTRQRARRSGGAIEYLTEPAYHGREWGAEDRLVYTDFAMDVLDALNKLDLSTEVLYYEQGRRDVAFVFRSSKQPVSDVTKTEPAKLDWTGERFVPWMEGARIHYAHLHRYVFAAHFVKGKTVLDLACGEGYGTYILAREAEYVAGVDIDKLTVQHARSRYVKDNLEFIEGSILAVPIEGGKKFDVAVCFEAIEHIAEHDKLLSEVKRLLKDDGLFIVSTPNKTVYTDEPDYHNPFHVKELYFDEFKILLRQYFAHIRIFGQRICAGSNMWTIPQHKSRGYIEAVVKKRDMEFHFAERASKEPVYFVAFASNASLKPSTSVTDSWLTDASNTLFNDYGKRLATLNHTLQTKVARTASLEARVKELSLREPEADKLRQRVTTLEARLGAVHSSYSWRITAPLRAGYRGLRWFLRNARRAFKLLGWLGTGQFTRAGQALLPYYTRYVPLRVKKMMPYRVRRALTRRLSAADDASMAKYVPPDGDYVPLLAGEAPLSNPPPVKLLAFYVPQFHRMPENDAFWGEGFTDWTNVRTAKPQFVGHYQPRVPGELRYYNLLDPAIQHRQVELAKLYGVAGFCFHFCWFNGKRPLEKPIETYLSDPKLDLPFCLCWVNENWTWRGDGRENEILIAQRFSAEDDLNFIKHVSKYLRDPRYIRVDGKPLLIVYRPDLLPSAKQTSRRWREWARNSGVGELYLAYTQSSERVDPARYDFDAAIEFPPDAEAKSRELPNLSSGVKPLRKDFACNVLDWSAYVRRSRNYTLPKHKLFRAVCPGWDNTPRRKNSSRVLHNSSPRGYHEWLLNAIADTCRRFRNPDERLVFVNAWNEWGEGAYLEPDAAYGYAYLEATRLALAGAVYHPLAKYRSTWNRAYLQGLLEPVEARPTVLLCAHSCKGHIFGAPRSFIDLLEAFAEIGVNVVCTLPRTNNQNYIDAVRQRSTGVYILPYQERSPLPEDESVIGSFIEIIQRHNVDVVHCNTIMLREPLTAGRRCDVVTVTHAREIITHHRDLAKKIGLSPAKIVEDVTSRSDYIIANSEATAQCYRKSRSVIVAPNMVDTDQMDLANEVDPANIRFALVSSNSPKKGLSDVVELAKRCEASVPNAQFLVVGPDTLHVKTLRKGQQEGRIPKNIQFSGYKETPREAMAEANVVLSLSHFKESFGRTATEAMAARRPVIAYDWGGLSELIRDRETGFLVDFRDIDQLVDRVKTLCENPGLISEMGLRGRAFVSRHYSAKRFAERLTDAYSTILCPAHSHREVCNFNLLRKAPPTAIIIPVYNAYEELRECIASVQKHTNLAENRLIVIDDASGDARIREFLESLNNIELICNEQNIGYTKTCNKGISLAAPSDVILLNSDTIVTPRWLESLRIAAYSAAKIGTATALSDNAGAFSVPVPGQENKKPDGIDYPDYARLMRQFCAGCEIPDVPTGNGFCLFIKRELIDEIGDFDAVAFPRGYGEENDFCMRAVNAGWRNVIAPAAFVFHHRRASFGAEKEQLVAAGMKVIKNRYPDYTQRVKDAFSSLAIKNLQRAAQRAAAAAMTTPVETRVAVLTRTRGTSNMEGDKVNHRFLVLVDADKILLPQADAMLSSQNVLTPVTHNFEQAFGTWLLTYGIDSVQVEALKKLPFNVGRLCDLFGVPFKLR